MKSPKTIATFAIVAAMCLVASLACGGGGSESPAQPLPTLDPDPPFGEQQAIEVAKDQHSQLLDSINFYGHTQVRIRTGSMLLRELQQLTGTELFSEGSPRLNRQIWAVQIGGNFGDHDEPYTIEKGYGIVGIDAQNGDIWLRARYDNEILLNPGE